MRKLQSSAFQPHGLWLVTGAAMLWGTIGVATQAIYNSDTTTPLFINLARMLVAAPVLLLVGWRVVGRQMFLLGRRDLMIMLLTGTLLAISQAAYFAAIQYTGVTIATLLTICLAPLVVTGLAVLLKLETLTVRSVIALICALAGSLLLVGNPNGEPSHANMLVGTAFSILAAATYGGMIICGRVLASDYHPLQVTAISFAIGSLVLIPINLANGIIMVHTAQGWLLLLYLGLVPTAFAYWIFQTGLRSVSATAASIAGMLDPVVAALLAWWLFGETLTFTGLFGAALLMVSLLLLAWESSL